MAPGASSGPVLVAAAESFDTGDARAMPAPAAVASAMATALNALPLAP
jgi:hypothetical protein